ncbi:MAG: hypothetical protein V3T19_07055 [Acidiferrobacterales bacterium]
MKDPSDASPVLDLIRSSESSSVVDGAFRAMAMLRLVPDDESVNEILCYVERLPVDDGMHFWVAAASAGWHTPEVNSFLATCENSGREDLMEAASLSRDRKYKKWRPL